MKGTTRFANWIIAVMLATQLVMMVTTSALVAALVPPVLAAVPMGFAISEQSMRTMKPRLNRAYIGITALSLAVLAFFYFGKAIPFRLQEIRALITDLVILWFAAVVALHLRLRDGDATSL